MNEARRAYRTITGLDATTVTQIHGGLNSRNYLIDGAFVLRIKEPSIDASYDPETEAKAEKAAAPLGLTPTLLHFDRKTGLKLTSFIPDTRFLLTPPTVADAQLVADAIKKLHGLKGSNLLSFDATERLKSYAAAAGVTTFAPVELKLAAHIRKLEMAGPLVLCHNDLVRGNLLFKEGRLYLIDYEYASRNLPLFDLASFVTENNIDDSVVIDAFLHRYYGENPIPKTDFGIYCRFLDYLWYYWAQGMYKKTGQSVYKTIAHVKHQRIARH